MPPFVPRKRDRSPALEESPPPKRRATARSRSKRAKQTLFEDADTLGKSGKSLEETKKYLDSLDDAESSDSGLESDDFEDVEPARGQHHRSASGNMADDDEDGMDWEDAVENKPSSEQKSHSRLGHAEPDIGDISISLNDDGTYTDALTSMAAAKKGPSKRERQMRVRTHCLHVQMLLWHNTIRNSWLNDKEVQQTLLDGLTDGVKREVTRWKEAMGTLSKDELEAKKKAAAAKNSGRKGRKGKDKSAGRDWNYGAEHLEQGVPNLSSGDPLLRLMKVLTAYWRKRFVVTAPGLRKQGYMPLRRLRDEIKSWEKDRTNAEEHGERIETRNEFRERAKKCEGSRDVGAQLFVALLRGIGLEARMVANLQPAGLGWSKAEDADPPRPKKSHADEAPSVEHEIEKESKQISISKKRQKTLKIETPSRKSGRGNRAKPINLEDSESSLSEPPSDVDEKATSVADDNDDDLSVIDITPPAPQKRPTKKYDRDLAFPNYWAEVCSPVSQKYFPVDPIVLSTIATNDELLQTFEPRGKKAELSKQVICYTIAFSIDGTAKDVTVRYLKKHQLPGKTKGMRMGVEKIPIYNYRGKVKKYEDYDWFRTVMSLYNRPQAKRTAADDLEDQTDLKPFKPAKEAKEVEKESLQWYKQSANYALEQHLRREEAILPGAKPVKMFTAGKGEKAKEHPVYLREDVVSCKTVESWHKEGRAIKEGEQPMKHVPMRAVTLIRKREMEDALRDTGEKLQQGLYSMAQTDWIIPPPIENGIIPKNAFGNMDVYVDTMVPKGATHLPLKGTAKLCKKLGIDFAEACTGFEFGKQRAVPVLTGVVVAQENAAMVRDAWRAEQKEIKRKEDTKRTDLALRFWRKMMVGLRIIDRMRIEYDQAGGAEEEYNPFVSKAKREGRAVAAVPGEDEDEYAGAGGFFAPGHNEEEAPQRRIAASKSANQDDDDVEVGEGFEAEDAASDAGAGGFLVEDLETSPNTEPPSKNYAPITPVSLQSLHKQPDDDVTMADGAGTSEDDQNDVPIPTKRTVAASQARKSRTAIAKPRRQSAGRGQPFVSPSSDEDEDESSLSELNDSSDDNDSDEVMKVGSAQNLSPRVIVPAQQKKTLSSTGRTRNSRAAKKSTPVKSQYFAAPDDEVDDGVESSEEEVVKPRRTTQRTRRRA